MAAQAWTLSIEDRQKLIQAAKEAKEFAYSPYSKFRVGAALLTTDGKIIKGANIENASYGGAICAERTAIVKAVSEGNKSFIGLAVTSDVPTIISPCGICRQVIREFCSLTMPVLLVPGDYPQAQEAYLGTKTEIGSFGEGGVKECAFGELLPESFGPEHLLLERKA